MSEDLRSEAWQHLEIANSHIRHGQYTEAFTAISKAEKLARKAKAHDILSAVIGTKASVLQNKGMFNEALELYTTALNIQEELEKIYPFFNTWVATTLKNLGNLQINMGRQEEAKKRYERALVPGGTIQPAILKGWRTLLHNTTKYIIGYNWVCYIYPDKYKNIL